jgi:hypothetical protein
MLVNVSGRKKDVLSHFLENTQSFTHKHEDMNLYIIHEKDSNLDKSTSMPLALTNGKRLNIHIIPWGIGYLQSHLQK